MSSTVKPHTMGCSPTHVLLPVGRATSPYIICFSNSPTAQVRPALALVRRDVLRCRRLRMTVAVRMTVTVVSTFGPSTLFAAPTPGLPWHDAGRSQQGFMGRTRGVTMKVSVNPLVQGSL
jgi:hypothetical protein